MAQLICIIHSLRHGAESAGCQNNEGSGLPWVYRIGMLDLFSGFVNATGFDVENAQSAMTDISSQSPDTMCVSYFSWNN